MTMKKFKKLEGDQCYVRRPGNPSEPFGAKEARQYREGDIWLMFEDGSSKIAPCDKDLYEFESWHAVVSYVKAHVNSLNL
jgi:hypothetical protein